jgi:tetratricopeptide (TPR) repeat protein
MPEPADRRIRAALRGRIGSLALALIVCSCGTPGSKPMEPIESRDQNGFAITETVHVGGRIRSDFERANRAFEEGETEKGIALLIEIAETAPELSAAHINLGIAYQLIEDFESAETSLLKALEEYPRHPVALNELGIVYRRTGRFEKARESYESALALYPDFHFARKNLAILCDLYLLDSECALEHYEVYSAAVPGDEAAEIWIADLLNRTEE